MLKKSFYSLVLPVSNPSACPPTPFLCESVLHPRHTRKGTAGSSGTTTGGGEKLLKGHFVLSGRNKTTLLFVGVSFFLYDFLLHTFPYQAQIRVLRRGTNETSRLPLGSDTSRDVNELLEIPQEFWFNPTWMQDISVCLCSLLFLLSNSQRTSFCCPWSQRTSCNATCYTWDWRTSEKTDPLTPGIAMQAVFMSPTPGALHFVYSWTSAAKLWFNVKRQNPSQSI